MSAVHSLFFFFSSRRRHTRCSRDWSSDVCSSDLLEGRIQALPLGGLNCVDARDAAAGLIEAMRSGKPGERYLLGGPNWSFREFAQNLSQVSGVRAPRIHPSLGFSLISARVLRRLLPLIGKSFALDDASIKMSALYWYCDSTKARTELGFKTRDPIETLKDTVESLRRRQATERPRTES